MPKTTGPNTKKQAVNPNNVHLLNCSSAPLKDLLDTFSTTENGLPDNDHVEANRDTYGPNILTKGKKRNPFLHLLLSFANPFSAVLLILAVVSFITDFILAAPGEKNATSSLIILALVLGSGLFRFFQEERSAKVLDHLSELVETTTAVNRDGESQEVPLEEVVVGDVISLAVGDLVPADARILTAKDLFLSQSALTGESEPVEKTPALADPNASLTDRSNLAFLGSTVVSGSGTALVLAVGDHTALGQIAVASAKNKKEKDRLR
jgi:Mg2+-importing ATPase